MKKILMALSIMVLFCSSGYSQSHVIKRDVRDASGKLLYRTSTSGNKTEVRSPTGKLLMKTKTTGDTTEVRTSSGKLIERVKNR